MAGTRKQKPMIALLSARVTPDFLSECERISSSAGYNSISQYFRDAVVEKNQRVQELISKER